MPYLVSTERLVNDNLNAPTGTKMVFNQTASPTGWTRVTSSNDVALRLVDGSSSVGTGGSVAFETAFQSKTPTATSGAVAGHALSTAETTAHTHGVTIKGTTGTPGPTGSAAVSSISVGTQYYMINTFVGSTSPAGSGNSHTHSFTQPSISAVNLDVSYVDVIIATKD